MARLTSLDPERIQCMHHVLESIGNALASGTIDALEAVTSRRIDGRRTFVQC